MKILLIHNFYRYTGGEDTYFLSLIGLLKQKGHKIILFTKNSKNIDGHLFSKVNIALNMFQNNNIKHELENTILRFKPDIAHFHNVFPLITPTAYAVCKDFRIPIVQTIHNYRFMCPKGILFRDGQICELCVNKRFSYPSIFHKCYQQSTSSSVIFSASFYFHSLLKHFELIDRFIFPAEFVKNYYLQHLPSLKNKVAVLPYFTENTIKTNIDKDKYFLFAGRFSEEKGIIPLLELFAKKPDVKLVAIGDGPLKNKVYTYQKYKNITIKKFLKKKRVLGYMKKALCTIIPSLWYEVLPLIMIESFSQNTPVIVPSSGTFNNLNTEGKTGIFFESGNFENLGIKLDLLIQNPRLAKSMSAFSGKEYRKKYTSSIHYQALIQLYENLLRKN